MNDFRDHDKQIQFIMTPATAQPVTAERFHTAMAALEIRPPVAVAVSGGADSMALLLLCRDWLNRFDDTGGANGLLALTVDHGLRPEAAIEARQVAEWCGAQGITHRTLRWTEDKPAGCIQAAARQKRYALLEAACLDAGIRDLLLAHHREDQAETLLLNLMRGSGVHGLSAMQPVSAQGRLRLIRPLLDFPKSALRATLHAAGQDWIEDPSNHDRHYARVRMRTLYRHLIDEGMPPERLTATALHMQRARAAIDHYTDELLSQAAIISGAGIAWLDPSVLSAAPEEVGLRALARLVTAIGAQRYTPRLNRLENLYVWLCDQPGTGGRTLSGCQLLPHRGRILILRELASIGPDLDLEPGQTGNWDGRFDISLNRTVAPQYAGQSPFTIRAVGAAGLQQIRALRTEQPASHLPALAMRAMPGVWGGDTLLAAPHLFYHHPQAPLPRDTVTLTFAPRHPVFCEPPNSGNDQA